MHFKITLQDGNIVLGRKMLPEIKEGVGEFPSMSSYLPSLLDR